MQGSWEFLLMESARKRDEEKSVRAAEDTVAMTKPPQSSPPSANPSAPEEVPPPSPVPLATDAAIKELSDQGDDIIVVSTYDGEWHPTDGPEK